MRSRWPAPRIREGPRCLGIWPGELHPRTIAIISCARRCTGSIPRNHRGSSNATDLCAELRRAEIEGPLARPLPGVVGLPGFVWIVTSYE